LRAPICNFCLTNFILCSSDQAKLEQGKISQLDIDVSRALYRLQKRFRFIDFLQVVSTKQSDFLVLVYVDSAKLLSYNELAELNVELKREMKKEIRILEVRASKPKLIQELLLPVKIVSHSNVWLPDGSQVLKVSVKNEDLKRLGDSVDTLKKMVSSTLDTQLFIEAS